MSDVNFFGSTQAGDPTESHAMHAWIIGDQDVTQSQIDTCYDGVESAFYEIYYHSDIAGLKIRKLQATNFSLNCSNWRDDINGWLDAHNYSHDGVYLFVTDCGFGRAVDWNGFEDRIPARVNADYYDPPSKRLEAVAVQETLHPYIRKECNPVNDMIENNTTVGWEHALGKVDAIGGDNVVTPMATTYQDEYAADGTCNRDRTIDGYTRQLTACTVDAVEYSRDHAYYNGYPGHH